ncbi:hypothetical protein CYL18_06135 [Pradoshia eiseniae]|uniref:Glycosyl transferase family 1 domain-containing protein n=1 Tax=Pradoshia eiseniae TaxID=2064768 RepID=A0A2S7N2F2_9BACI|nr:glycosyltransferase family 4 protein [Pradoshia eiseniae]PQD96177.1 hypothetical protein CYL18_06135 [Pradoshia eiseniae]
MNNINNSRTNKNYKVIVAHPAMQHSFHTAIALKKNNNLFKYITTVYDKEFSLTRLFLKFLKGNFYKKLAAHKTDGLDDNDVLQISEFESLLLLALRRIDKKRRFVDKFNNFIIKRFNIKVAKYAIKNHIDAIILYDTLALTALEYIKSKKANIKLILDMSAPNAHYMDIIYKNDIKLNPEISIKLIEETQTSIYKQRIKTALDEMKLADYFLVASTFTKKSLVFDRVSESKIINCQYGIDYSRIVKRENKSSIDKRLNCIFVGNVTQKKGIFYLFQAIDVLGTDNYQFNIIGDYDRSDVNITKYKEKCNFTGHITKDKLKVYLSNADVMVFPSLCDGFGFAALEALASGIPVISTKNAGVSDLIVNGHNGYIVEAGNSKQIIEKLSQLEVNRDLLSIMSENASKTPLDYQWEDYYSLLNSAINKVLTS